MINISIVDDEQHCSDRLLHLLQQDYLHETKVTSIASNVPEGILLLEKQPPDLLFLDVQIGDYTGFDLLRSLNKIDFQVIFVTAFDKYAVEAIKHSALYYLLKPVDKDDLALAMTKYRQSAIKDGVHLKQIEILLGNISRGKNQSKRIAIPTLNGLEIIEASDIIHLESSVNYTYIFLKDKTKLFVAKTLREFEDMLSAYSFCRIHNSHLVNLTAIKRYVKGSGGSVILNDGTELPVSQRKKEELMAALADM